MYKIQYSKKATINLAEIYAYIAEDNLFYAKDVVDHIKKSIEIVKQFPLLGTKQGEANRYTVEPRYRYKIVYQIRSECIYIISVFKYRESWQE